jgi:AbiV family abortive infection protein
MQEGIDLCKSNITHFLDDAKILMKEGSAENAYVLVQFGIEEWGKIIMLKEALSNSDSDPVLVDNTVFTSHKGKTEKALTNPYLKTINEGFEEDVRGMPEDYPAYFDPSTEASHATRCECAFVDFHNGEWVIGCKIDRNLLVRLIVYIEHILPKL